jgi:serine/threonine-protein kinase
MGVVYKARDTLMNRQVALKTILDIENRSALDLFYKEWAVQASIVHPNIVEIYDIGEFEEGGAIKPFFVMPLLPGVTLDQMIREGSPSLTVERSIGIICQACRGLQAAHDQGLVHRDLKPSNLFVMEDDSVKIIDFGVAHLSGTGAKTTLKGTLTYMAPEQLEMKAPSPLSDIFSLAVVCYQTLTRRLPFQGNSEYEITEAILKHSPAPVSEINSAVNEAISSVVHKAMAKRPWHRFPNAREFAEALQKALHNQPLAFLDPEKIKPRIERARKAFGEGDYDFASEILFELEAEGHLDAEITLMRRQLDQAVRKSTIRQLIESARRFFEAGEYGLALRKTQEALDLDNEDADVLALKNQIEKERHAKQIDEWFLLARQHIDNQAFGQARQAIDSVLKVRPNDTQALQLVAEVERLEREAAQSREEKKKLYDAAMKAWQKGEITASLSKLESLVSLERDRPDTDSGRGSTYQTFYQQVRSEHDAIKNAYEEARNQLRDNNFSAARAICDQYLAKYPYHALFQALKVDLEEQQRQKLSAFIAETDQRVDEEPDLDRRLGILEEALKSHPEEVHFERAARNVREKRDLVNSIVAKARFFEEKGQLNEALDQWQILRTIHARYPGLELEIERLTKRRDQQARTESKARWGEQIDRHLETGDYDRAVEICQTALAEFPEDDSLLELEKLARKSKERSTEAMKVLNEGRELCDKGQTEAGLAALRQAHQLDTHSPVARKVLVNYLISAARQLVDSDWEGADKFVREVLELEPDHSPALSLRNQIADHKREEFVNACVVQARRLQADGDIEAAHAAVVKGLAAYPNEPRLRQLLGTIERAQGSGGVKITPATRAFEELKRLEKAVAIGVDASSATQLTEQVRAIATRHPEEQAIQSLAAQLRNRLAAVITGSAAPAAGSDAAAAGFPTASALDATHLIGGGAPALPRGSAVSPPASPHERPDAATGATAAASTAAGQGRGKAARAKAASGKPPGPSWGTVLQQQLASLAKAVAAPGKQRRQLLIVGSVVAGVVLAVALGFVVWSHLHQQAAPPPVAAIRVSLQASPAEAAIWVGDQQCGVGSCAIELPPGTHQAQARLPGYQAAVVSFEVAAPPAEQKPVVLLLEPLAPILRLTSDLESGEVLLDGTSVGKLEDGQFELANLSLGEHTLEVTDRGSKASITFEVRAGAIPMIQEPIQTRSLKVAAVGILGTTARLFSDGSNAGALLDGEAAGQVPTEGLDLANLAEGAHQVQLGEGRDQLTLAFNTGGVPTLAAFLKSDRNVGGLRIEAGEDDVTVYLNGEVYRRRKTQRGRLLIYLPPRQYTVRVEKPGFEPVSEQTAEVRRGEEASLQFKLTPLPETASLTIRNAPPGAEVLVDGKRLGTISAGSDSGTFTLAAGNHTVGLRQESYSPKEWQRQFKPGEAVELDGTLSSLNGTLEISVEPAGVTPRLTLRHDRETQERPITSRTMTLPEGTYTVTARADGYQEFAATVRVVANTTSAAKITLSRQPQASTRPISLLSALAQSGWVQEGNLLTHRGGDFVLVPQDPRPGTYQFTIFLQNGRRLEWVVNFKDEKNYVLFQLERNQLNRSEVVNGQRSKPVRLRHDAKLNEFLTVSVEVSSDTILHRLYHNQQWSVLDTWKVPGASFSQGKFGFHIPGRDKIGLSSFTFTPL